MSAVRNDEKPKFRIPTIVSLLAVCAALVIGISVFFKVSVIEVSGASRYTDEELIKASGIKEGRNLIFLDGDKVSYDICSQLVYVSDVKIEKKFPNKILIVIEGSEEVAVVETEDGIKIIDSKCRVLEDAGLKDVSGYISVKGLMAMKTELGEELLSLEEDKAKIKYLKEILTAMEEQDMLSHVKEIDLTNPGNAKFDYLGRFTVKLGNNKDTGIKLSRLKSAIELLDENETGSFDLSKDKKAGFIPEA